VELGQDGGVDVQLHHTRGRAEKTGRILTEELILVFLRSVDDDGGF
jgi:hypothetical protein